MGKLRYLRWEIKRYLLWNCFVEGAESAYLPAFLDRCPRCNLHRAEKSAFMRGLRAKQKTIREAT